MTVRRLVTAHFRRGLNELVEASPDSDPMSFNINSTSAYRTHSKEKESVALSTLASFSMLVQS